MSMNDPYAGVMEELLGAPAPAPDASLIAAVAETSKDVPVSSALTNEYLSHIVGAYTVAVADARAAREAADVRAAREAQEKELLRLKGHFGWVIAGALGAIVLVLLAMRNK